MTEYTPLRLIAQDHEDLKIVAAHLQDALISLAGLEYDPQKNTFHLVANRFCWECAPESVEGTDYYNRVLAGLLFHHVKTVQKKNIDLSHKDDLINLLTIEKREDGCIYFIFSGGSEIKIEVEQICCHLKDMDEPYPTHHKPSHGIK